MVLDDHMLSTFSDLQLTVRVFDATSCCGGEAAVWDLQKDILPSGHKIQHEHDTAIV